MFRSQIDDDDPADAPTVGALGGDEEARTPDIQHAKSFTHEAM